MIIVRNLIFYSNVIVKMRTYAKIKIRAVFFVVIYANVVVSLVIKTSSVSRSYNMFPRRTLLKTERKEILREL